MAILKIGGAGTAKPDVEIDKRVEFNINRNLNDKQKASGVIAKVQIRHPAFTTTATVWNRNGKKSVTLPQQESERNDKTSYFTLINLNKEVRDYILYLVEHDREDNSAWYLEGDELKICFNFEDNNADLGIESIIADANLSNGQVRAGMLAKVNIITTIGSLYSYTIWNSKFGNSLFGTPPPAGGVAEDGTRGAPAYRLSWEATKQVLRYLHKNVDWDVTREVPADNVAENAPTSQDDAAGFTPVGDDVIFNAETEA